MRDNRYGRGAGLSSDVIEKMCMPSNLEDFFAAFIFWYLKRGGRYVDHRNLKGVL